MNNYIATEWPILLLRSLLSLIVYAGILFVFYRLIKDKDGSPKR